MPIFYYIITLCWIIFLLYWIRNWRNVKPSIGKKYGMWQLRIYATLLIFLTIIILKAFGVTLGTPTFATFSTLVGTIGAIFTVTGLTIAITARHTLGNNWSSNVELKKGHMLITTGVYGVVRHPIYLGMFLMALGAIMVFQSLIVFIIFFFVSVVFLTRINREEELMMKTFPEDYPKYKKRVKALIPYIW